jgi:hypothetical protein
VTKLQEERMIREEDGDIVAPSKDLIGQKFSHIGASVPKVSLLISPLQKISHAICHPSEKQSSFTSSNASSHRITNVIKGIRKRNQGGGMGNTLDN